MNTLMRAGSLVFSFWLMMLHMDVAAGDADATATAVENRYGDVRFDISCSEDARKGFNESLALLHHMMYAEAHRRFSELISLHPDCAMLYWGVSMTRFHPLWPGEPDEIKSQQGADAIAKARQLKPSEPIERAFIRATQRFYDGWKERSYEQRIKRWAKAQKKLYMEYKDNTEAAVFYALSQLAIAPKSDRSFSKQKEAGALLESLYTQQAQHPGVIHYIIHAYDNPELARQALQAARAYDKIAPDVPHALHMPSHIFVRLGHWVETVNWNLRSANAALNFPVGSFVSHHYPHAQDYLIYAYLQMANSTKARAALESIYVRTQYQPTFVSGYALAAMPARYQLERKQWAEAAILPIRKPTGFPWDKFPQVEAITYFARALGAVRNGNVHAARLNLATLNRLLEHTTKAGQTYWATLIDAQRQAIEAWILYLEGNYDAGLKLMAKAADQEDSVDKHPVTPGSVLPLREIYGDMLMNSQRYEDALDAYEASLEISPNRYYSIHGAGRAAELAGNSRKASAHYSELLSLTGDLGHEREETRQAMSYIGVSSDE
ncbi:tetratricopeptide repeat protein [Marinobacterium jannaschii]|uniref:tetratricopeptide repeat protein n=1 Tax=Marinobacterium jannaschii TaxID=64970 RepID=UPI000685D1DF|nr:tetratricopeptide repeat protein [Marinobacterium jannaschii]